MLCVEHHNALHFIHSKDGSISWQQCPTVSLLSEENSQLTIENIEPPAIIDSTSEIKRSSDEVLEFSREIQETAGQISEILREEENTIGEFFNALLKVLKKFGKSIEIQQSSLPKIQGKKANKAYLYPSGQLVLVYENAEVDLLNITEQNNREILVAIMGDIMVGLKTMINTYKTSIEKRVKFLLSITKELQKIARVFAEK